jgi:hypothetical protein
MNMLGLSSNVHFAHRACYWKIHSFCNTHKSSVSKGFAEQIMPILDILCYNGSLVSNASQSESHIATEGQSINKPWCRAPSGAHDQICITLWQLRYYSSGAPSLTKGRVCLLYMLLAHASVVFLGSSPLGLVTIFYSLRFETSLFVASYDSQGHGGGIQTRLHLPEILVI